MDLVNKIATRHIQAKSYDRIVYSPKPINSFRNARQRIDYKPAGLWYECNKAWKEFVQREGFGHGYRHKYLLEVNLNRMCVIRTVKELLDFQSKYGVKPRPNMQMKIDWVAVSKDYDGIEICPYQSKLRLEIDWYYPWDVASGCVWGSGAFKSLVEVDNDIDDSEFESIMDWDDYDDEEW